MLDPTQLTCRAGRRFLSGNEDAIDAVRLDARSVEQAVALAQAGIDVQPAAVVTAPAPGYEIAPSISQAPMPEAALRLADTLTIGTPSIAPGPDAMGAAPSSDTDTLARDAMGPAPSSDTDTLARDVVDLPLYSLDGYGL